VTLTGATHLLPLERAADIARLIDEHARAVTDDGDASATIDAGYDALIASGRVGARTRAALRARQHADDADYVPAALDMAALTALRAVIARVVPQTESGRLDLAARIDRELAAGHGDGWRFAQLPPDALAYRIALATIDDAARRAHGDGFARLDGARQDDLLTRIAAGRIGRADAEASGDRFSADQLRAWFEDLRADAVRAYIGHPRTLARIGYSGIANGGDGQPKSGFVRIGIGEREAWEPIGLADAAR